MPRTGAAGIAGLICLGLPVSGLAHALPEAVRVLAALAGVLVLPGAMLLPLARAFADGGSACSARTVSISFLLGVSALSVWTDCFRRAGAGFGLYADATTWALLLLYGGAAIAGIWGRGRRAPVGGDSRVAARCLLVILPAMAFAAMVPPSLSASRDSFDHIGCIRRVMALDAMQPDGLLAWPTDASIAVPPDPRKGALHPLLALVASAGGADPAAVWRWLPVVMFPAALLAFVAFNGVFVRTLPGLAACVALFFLSYGGNAFQFVTASADGQQLAATWCWALVPAAVVLARRGTSLRRLGATALLVVGGVLVHLGVFVHALVIAATLVLFGRWLGLERRRGALAGGAVALVGALVFAARAAGTEGAMNAVHAHVQGVLFLFGRWFVASPMEILRHQGLVFLGGIVVLPVLLPAARSRPDARAILAASAFPVALAFTPLAVPLFERGSYMAFRVLLNAPVFAAIVASAAWMVGGARRRGFAVRVLAAASLTLWALVFLRPSLDGFAADFKRSRPGTAAPDALVSRELRDAVASLPAGRTVLSDPATSYVLSAYTTHRFVAIYQQHANPYDAYALDRLRAVRDALSPFAVPDAALAACRRYRVDYVVVNSGREAGADGFLALWDAASYGTVLRRLASMPASFAPIDSVGGGMIFRFDPAAPVNWSWTTNDAPVAVESPPLSPCEVEAPDRSFRVTGVAVDPPRAAPGDTVTVALGYQRGASSSFGLPTLIHLRFDHESVATRRRYPGEKYVRRAAERRRGVFTRFRRDVQPGHGVFEPDLWPIGAPLCERFRVAVPPGARAGRYRIEVALAADALLPNFHAVDLLYNRDHYSGEACAELTVAAPVPAGGRGP